MNTLSQAQNFQLYDWLKEQKALNKLNGLTRAQIAIKATDALGFDITISNVRGPCGVLDIACGSKAGAGTRKARNKKRLITMAKELIRTQKALGMEISSDLEFIANDSHMKV